MGYNIAIDGPAGAGKSTIAKLTAKKLGYIYVDTGAMYRAMAIHFQNNKIEQTETEKIIGSCKNADITITYENGTQQVYLDQKNITDRLREESVGNMASVTSAIPAVREKLLSLQQDLARNCDVVMDGRDIGTNVLPNANVKIYLTASVETRAKRRFLELEEKREACSYEDIVRDITNRDKRDMERETAPLRQAEDAVFIDSSNMTIEEVTARILDVCRKKNK